MNSKTKYAFYIEIFTTFYLQFLYVSLKTLTANTYRLSHFDEKNNEDTYQKFVLLRLLYFSHQTVS